MFRHGIPAALAACGALTLVAAASASRTPITAKAADASLPRTSASVHAAPTAASIRFVPAPTGNEVRYRVREQLVGHDLPNDAVGATDDVTGALVVDDAGAIVPGESKFTVNVATLKSDRDRRDGYVRRRILQTDSFPTVQLAPAAIQGLPSPLPTSGEHTFQMIGNLTVRGVTHPTTWQVKATFDGNHVTGSASTGFTFADFGLTQPKVSILLSVADSIHLEYDFDLIPAHTPVAGS